MNPKVRAVIRALVLVANTPLAIARARKAFSRAGRPFRLEIGGLHRRDGWVITNVNAVTRNYLDATSEWPIEDGAVSRVYADNVIEHVPLRAGRTLLAEAYRCLQPGGVIRLVTPDVGKHVDMYLAGEVSVQSDVAASYRSLGLTVEHAVDLVRIPIGSFGHHAGYVYDFDTLKIELEQTGFMNVVHCEINESAHDDLVGIDRRSAEGQVQMAVEGTR